MKILQVIPLKKGINKENLTYFTSLEVNPGDIVSIPVRKKNVLGLVINQEELQTEKSNIKNMDFNLRKITETKGPSLFRKEFLDAVFDTGKYFAQNKNIAISSLIPKILIEEYDKIIPVKKEIENTENKNRNIQPEKMLFQYPIMDRISIYKTLIRESFAKGKSVFMVAPTELDINKLAENLTKGIEQFTFIMHSGISSKKNLLAFKKANSTEHPILLICTPPFLSMPRLDIGTIILEHESSSAYKMIARPYFDMRTFVEIFASKINAKLILADDLLRFETLERKEQENLNTLHPLSFRTNWTGELQIINRAKKDKISASELKEDEDIIKKFQILENEVLIDINKNIQNKKNVFVFALRKGLATTTVCRDCGDTVSCDVCSSTLVLYTSQNGTKRMFVCNKCNTEKDANTKCETCGGWNLTPLGIGTDTVYEFLKEIFPENKIFKLDKEVAKNANDAKKIIEEFEQSTGAILVGTEMATMYMKNKVALSVISSFDSLWGIPNFKMGEKILRIMLSIIDKTTDKFIIQAKNTKDGAIAAIEQENVLSFVREELRDRKNLEYPPFKRFIKISYMGDKEETQRIRKILSEVFAPYNPDIFSGFISKVKNKYMTNMLIKMAPEHWSLSSISLRGKIDEKLYQKISSLPPNFQVFVDPEDLL